MKKRFRNTPAKCRKKNRSSVLMCVTGMILITCMITGCSPAEENAPGTQIDNEITNTESSQEDSGNHTNSQTVPPKTEEPEKPQEPAQESMPDAEESLSSDGQELKRIAEEFVTAYFTGDTDGIQSFLAVPFEWDTEVYTGTGTISDIIHRDFFRHI